MKTKEMREVVSHIKENSARLDMLTTIAHGEPGKVYVDTYNNLTEDHLYPDCGTVACFAGWAFIKFKLQIESQYSDVDWLQISEKVQELLELPNGRLFHVSTWPKDLAHKYYDAETHDKRADALSEAVEAYINNHEDFGY